MNQSVTAVPLTMASKLSWRSGVRRRHVHGRDFLIRITNIHPLDTLTAALWDLIDDRRTLYEIFQEMEKIQHRLSDYQGIESVVGAAMTLLQLGYLENTDAGQDDYERQFISNALKQSVCELMQCFYTHASDWQENLSAADIDKIYQRFTQIFYEYEVAQCKNTGRGVPDKYEFIVSLASAYILHEKQCLEWFKKVYEIRTWRYDMQENRIVIVYLDTVYSGDLDNRL
ncbi:MAG: hypothetical protein ABW072_14930 [Sedimenticola sp.]